MADAYAFEDSEDAFSLARYVHKLRSNLKSRDTVVKFLKLIAHSLEASPQDVSSLGPAQQTLEEVLIDKNIINSKHKDVRIFAAACMAHMLRIYAPETPYEDRYLEPIFDLLLWSVQQVADYQSPMFETALTVVQIVNQTKSYFLMLDMGREDLVVDWVRTLLQAINAGSSAMAGPHILELLQGIVGDESTGEAVLEVLLSQLVPPRSMENPHACQVAQAVLKSCEGEVKPQLQKYLTRLILSPISTNTDLHQQCYTLIYQLYQSVPDVLLPVIPHLTSELQSGDGNKRLEAVQLLCKLFSLPGSKLVTEYEDVLEALLGRYQDTKIEIRLTMLESTNALAAGVCTDELQQRVLQTASSRLQDFEEKVRTAAVKAICQTSRRLLVGPTPTAPGSAGTAATKSNQLVLTAPPADLLGQLGSQEDDAAEAAELGVDYTPPETAVVPLIGSGTEAQVRDLAYVQEVLQRVSLRLRDTKINNRKAAADGLLSVFRAVAAAGNAEQLGKVCWLPNRIILCMKSDVELRAHIIEVAMKDGLLGPQATAGQAAAAWVRLWVTANQLERDALMQLLRQRSTIQADALAFVGLRCKSSGKDKDDCDTNKQRLDAAASRLARGLPQPDKAMEGLTALMAVRDNHVYAALQQAVAPETAQQAYAKARADALARVGSRSVSADFISQLLLWARPAAWLPGPVLAALLELVACEPSGEMEELVRAAYEMLQKLAKNSAMLFSGLLPQLLDLLRSRWPDLQQLGAVLLARCFVQQRKAGLPPATSSTDAAVVKVVKQQLLPCLRQLARGRSSAGAKQPQQRTGRKQRKAARKDADEDDEEDQPDDEDQQQADDMEVEVTPSAAEDASVAAPKASKWAVYALATCQDSSSCKKELSKLADELASSLDSAEPETAGKLQALSAVGRILPEVFGRHVEAVMSFILGDYLLSYLDASITQPTGISLSQHSRSPLIAAAGDAKTDSQISGSQAPDAAAVWLKAAAMKALAAGCVPDSDGHDVPVETMRAVARLTQELEGHLEPTEQARPEFLADISSAIAGVFRLGAAAALLRLSRRHDSRITPSCYCMLALMMQDDLDTVRAAFSVKVFKLVQHFLRRPSTHQLSAKYAAMLPLGAMDPSRENKDAAARQLREWVHSRRQAVQQKVTAAAAAGDGGARGGGSTLQDMPEMILPYGVYILAHHPDFPQGDDAEDVSTYDPFQFMLQFMLQPLLMASAGMPAGATAPALIKMCKFLKRTADTADEPCTQQLYTLCDLSVATLRGLADHMGLAKDLLSAQYPGSITLPKGLYRPLDKEERGADDMSYLPQDFEVTFDPEPAKALAQPHGKAAGAAGASRGRTAGTGRGSKHRAQQKIAADAARGDSDAPAEPKRAVRRTSTGGAGGKRRASAGGAGGRRGKRVAQESDDGWEDSDEDGAEEAPPSAQQLTKRQQLLQQQKGEQQQQAAPPSSTGATLKDDGGGKGEAPEPPQRSQQRTKQQQQHNRKSSQQEVGRQANGVASEPKQRQQQRSTGQQQPKQQQGKLKQQPLTAAFNQAATHPALADASSPAPAKSKPRAEQILARRKPAAVASHSEGGSSADDSAGTDAAVDSPIATGSQPNGALKHDEYDLTDGEGNDDSGSHGAAAGVAATNQHSRGKAAAKSAAAADAADGCSSKPPSAAAKRPKSATASSQQQQTDTAKAHHAKRAAAGGSAGRAKGKVGRSAALVADDGVASPAVADTEKTKVSKAAGVKRQAAAAGGSGRATRRRAA